MSIGVISSARSVSQMAGDAPSESGPLGALDVLASDEVAAVSGPLSLDDARAALHEECRALVVRLKELRGLHDQSQQLRDASGARRTSFNVRVREIEVDLKLHRRQEIVGVFHDLCQAEVEFTGLNALCEHLQHQIGAVLRAHRNAQIALRALAEGTPLSSSLVQPRMSDEYAAPAPVPLADDEALLRARDCERQLLAQAIDERICGVLSSALVAAGSGESALEADPVRARDAVDRMRQRVNDALGEAKILTFELNPAVLDELGLAAALSRYAHDLATARGAPIQTRIETPDTRPHASCERAMFRAARAAIDNALRHGQARHITVALRQQGTAHILTVEDDGVGCDLARIERDHASGLGQIAMEAAIIGADLLIDSGPGQGTRMDFVVEVP